MNLTSGKVVLAVILMNNIEKYRNEDGFINLNFFNNQNINDYNKFSFDYNNKKYYFKRISKMIELYNELIAEEIAHDYNMKCAHYDLAEYDENIGVISENFLKEEDKFILLHNILSDYFIDNKSLKHNNLVDISYALEKRYGKVITNQLMEELYNIFVFDILTANIDRHDMNLGIIENNNVSFAPLFDNEKILMNDTIYEGIFSLGTHNTDDEYDYIIEFINIYGKDKIKDSLWIIDEENVYKILNRVEQRINSSIPKNIKEIIEYRFSENRKRLNKILKNKIL